MVGQKSRLTVLAGGPTAGYSPPSLVLHPGMLRTTTFPGFALYARGEQDGEFTMFHGAQEPVYVNTEDKLARESIDRLYVRGEDAPLCFRYVEQHLAAVVGEGEVPARVLAGWVYKIAADAVEELLKDPAQRRRWSRLLITLQGAARVMMRDPGASWQMLVHAPARYHVWSHSINVCVLLTGFAAQAMGIRDPGLLAEIALGGALHDLGKTRTPARILSKPTELNYREFAQVVRHPREGLKIARPHMTRQGIAQRIIVQHHENAAGGGYPEGRSGTAINVFARVAHIADAFDALTSRRAYGSAMDSYRAIKTMVTSMRGHFDVDMLRRFIHYLADDAGAGIHVSSGHAADTMLGPPLPLEVADALPLICDVVRAVGKPDTDFVPGLRRRYEDVSAAAGQRTQGLSELALILSSLEGRFSRRLRAALRAQPRDNRLPDDPPTRNAILRRFGRRLFRLVWQLDGWLDRLSAPRETSAPVLRSLRCEFADCLRSLRRQIVQLLNEHGIQPIETASAFDPRIHRRAGRQRVEAGKPARVLRSGFVQRTQDGIILVEPARVAPYPALRHVG